MRHAQQARKRAAEIMSMRHEPEDPDVTPVAAWKTELEARQRQAIRQEPMPRVPAAEAITGPEAGITGPEAAD
jgi:hypothetical protein